MKDLKQDYICAVPFNSLEIHDHKRFLCCASWLTKYLPDDSSPSEAWNSKEANDIRDSILDGSYRYCDEMHCPFLRQLQYFGEGKGRTKPLFHKSEIPAPLQDQINRHQQGTLNAPESVQFSFDRTCNLQCPSCRIELFTANRKKIEEVEATIEQIENEFSENIKILYITGSGDPFVSVGFRKFLRNFDPKKYPKLERIHLHTNATMWTKEMWDSMPNIHKYVKSCEISIDAATKDTYENKTRIGGDWDKLMNNLKFINTIPNLKYIKTSFVVQWLNYREMPIFYKLMKEIFGHKSKVYYGKITNWGTFTEDEFKEHEIWNPNHPEYGEFVEIVNRTLPAPESWSNLQEFIKPTNKLI